MKRAIIGALALLASGCVAASRDMTCGGMHMASDKSTGETMRARSQRPENVPTKASYNETVTIAVRPATYDVAVQSTVAATCEIPPSATPSIPQ